MISREEYDAIFVMAVILGSITCGVLYFILKNKTSLSKEKINGFSAAAAIAVAVIVFDYNLYSYRGLPIINIIFDIGITTFAYRITTLIVRLKTKNKD